MQMLHKIPFQRSFIEKLSVRAKDKRYGNGMPEKFDKNHPCASLHVGESH